MNQNSTTSLTKIVILTISLLCTISSTATAQRLDKSKLSADLLSLYEKPKDFFSGITIELKSSLLNEDLAVILKEKSHQQYKNYVVFLEDLSREKLGKLLQDSTVVHIAIENQKVQTDALSRVVDLNLMANHVNTLKHKNPNLRGQGRVISIKEPAYDSLDIDLGANYLSSDRVATFSDNHATEMATIAVGSGNSFVNGMGVANLAQHLSTDYSDVLPEEDSYYFSKNISIENHSYGTAIENFYGVLAAAYDESTVATHKTLHIFSSGNQGSEASSSGLYAGISGWANLTGNFKQAKNVLTVGATDTTGFVPTRSSRGPAYDGRLKPEIVAYSSVGTSNSAALVSGTSLLLQQAYAEQYNKEMPSDLLKGILMNSASDIENPGPDFKSGYGQLNAVKASEIIEKNWFIVDTLDDQTERKTHTISLSEPKENLKVMLHYHDQAAAISSTFALVHDLDLMVVTPSADTLLPSILRPTASLEGIEEVAKPGKDRLNNHEQVIIKNAMAGTYQIIVDNYRVDEKQSFTVNYHFQNPGNFQFLSPVSSDNLPYDGETAEYIRWESTLSDSHGSVYWRNVISFTEEQEEDWHLIKSNVPLNRGYLRWLPPDEDQIGQVKLVTTSKEFRSDTFTISYLKRLRLALNCTDSILLNWDVSFSTDSVELYQVVNFKPQKVKINDIGNQAFIKRNRINSGLFFIQPYQEGRKMLRTETIDLDLQTQSCYLISFFAEAEQDEGIRLNFQLGSVLGLQQVEIERSKDGVNWNPLDAIKANTIDLMNNYLDEEPDEGINFYRLNLVFNNDEILQSDNSAAYFVKESEIFVYPNPKSASEDLRIFSDGPNREATFTLFDLRGNLVYRTSIQLNRTIIDIPLNLVGLHIYTIRDVNNNIYNGKLIFHR